MQRLSTSSGGVGRPRSAVRFAQRGTAAGHRMPGAAQFGDFGSSAVALSGADASIVRVMPEAMESASQSGRQSFDSALAYGDAAMRALFAFARAGARSLGAFIDAGVQTVEAFDAAHRSGRHAPTDRTPT